MIDFEAKDILEALEGILLAGNERKRFRGVSIDSRTVQPGQLFFCIIGERFDGHEFIEEVLNKNVAGIVMEKKENLPDLSVFNEKGIFIIHVNNTLKALQECARYYRKQFKVRMVAITGTNGKTTAKEMTAAIAETQFKTLKTQGNFNNHIGLPLTLFNLNKEHEAAVLEMGMSAAGEIRRLAEIAEPEVGLITNISDAHLTSLGNIKKVQAAKGELFEALSREGTAVVNADDPLVLELSRSLRSKMITFAINNHADIRASHIRSRGNEGYDFTLNIFNQKSDLFLPYPGQFNIYNALGAIAVSYSLGIETGFLQTALHNCKLPGQRLEILSHDELTLINDSYNANPGSMLGALQFLAQYQTTGRRFFVIGDMLELGPIAEASHVRLGERVAESSIDFLITVGTLARLAGESAGKNGMPNDRILICESHKEAAERLKEQARSGDCVLVKGSRGSRMEKVIEGLTHANQAEDN